jgi:hypothetical protein
MVSALSGLLRAARGELRNIDTGTRSVKVVDQRPAEARVYREKVEGNAWKFLADDAFHPRVLDIVSARISTAIPDRNESLTVYLTRFDVGVFSGANCRDVAVGYNATRGAALGAEMIRGPVRALSCLSASESGIAFIEMKVGEHKSTRRNPPKSAANAPLIRLSPPRSKQRWTRLRKRLQHRRPLPRQHRISSKLSDHELRARFNEQVQHGLVSKV